MVQILAMAVAEIVGLLVQSLMSAEADKRAHMEALLAQLQASTGDKVAAAQQAIQALRANSAANPEMANRLDRAQSQLDSYNKRMQGISGADNLALAQRLEPVGGQLIQAGTNMTENPDANLSTAADKVVTEYNQEQVAAARNRADIARGNRPH